MKIFLAKLKDAKDIANVEMSSGHWHDKSFDALKNSINLLRNKKEVVLVAKEKNKIVGYISFKKLRNTADLGFLAVLQEFQGKGIGLALMKACIEHAEKLGFKKITLSVNKNNSNAISLYNKLGFWVIRKEEKKIGNRKYEKLIMEKSLV